MEQFVRRKIPWVQKQPVDNEESQRRGKEKKSLAHRYGSIFCLKNLFQRPVCEISALFIESQKYCEYSSVRKRMNLHLSKIETIHIHAQWLKWWYT